MLNLLSSTGLIIGLVLFAVLNLFAESTLRAGRIDLTENRLFTLSEGTLKILSNLDQKLTLRFYFSEELATEYPGLSDYGRRVREMLEEYQAHAGDDLELLVFEPEAFSEEEDEALAFGLSAPPVNQAGDKLFFGLVGTNSVDDIERIPFFDPQREEFLEYDLSELVSNLSRFEKKIVGVLSSLPIQGGMSMPGQPPRPAWFVMDQLERSFETRTLDPASTTEIPDEIGVLLIVHPKGFAPGLLWAIDQFVLGGGKVIAFVDPFCENDQSTPPGGNPMMAQRNSDLGPLLKSWGVELVERKLAGDREAAMQVGWRDGPVDYLLYLELDKDNLSQEDVVTGDLSVLRMTTPGILRPVAGATTTLEPLIQTSTQSQEIDSMSVQFAPDPPGLLNAFQPSGERFILAARISGSAKSAFPGGNPSAEAEEAAADPVPEAEEGSEETEPETSPSPANKGLTESKDSIHVLVVADVDMLGDEAWVRIANFLGSRIGSPTADNGSLVLNAVENMTGNADLIGLRSRGSFARPFTRKRELARQADERYRAKEQQLEARLQETEREINELQQQKDAGSVMILSPEQQEALERFEQDRLDVRKDLRKVRHDLRKDIESLGMWLKFVNIGLVPLLIAVAGATLMGAQSARRKAR
jgi:ABC-type uncharacterized transport system involved in gliding motility auxiliary subunit